MNSTRSTKPKLTGKPSGLAYEELPRKKRGRPTKASLIVGTKLLDAPKISYADAENLVTDHLALALANGQKRYGMFTCVAELSRSLKYQIHTHENWPDLAVDQQEALDMIMHKTARILCGDPTYADSWIDIAGYAKLIYQRLEGNPHDGTREG